MEPWPLTRATETTLLGQNRRRHPPELGIGLETAATGATYDIDGGQQLPSNRGGT